MRLMGSAEEKVRRAGLWLVDGAGGAGVESKRSRSGECVKDLCGSSARARRR
jgi:hypothetical protein